MKSYRSILCILLAAAMVLVFCACGKDETPKTSPTPGTESAAPSEGTPEESTTPGETVQSKDTFLLSDPAEFTGRPKQIQSGTSVNLICSDVPSQVPWNCVAEGWLTTNIYEGLIYLHHSEVSDVRGLVAESWTHSDDYLTWTFQIRDGITFSDGTVCDAAAIAKSWDIYNEASPASFTNKNMVSWVATGDNELVITLSAPCSYFEPALYNLYIVSPTALEQYGTDDNRAAIGTGPYTIESYSAGVGFVLKANPNYYFDEKMPCIETFNFSIIKDNNTKLMALMNGDVDLYNFDIVENYYNLDESGYEGKLLSSYGNANPFFLNAKTVTQFQTFEVRKAMNRFLDLDALNNIMYDGMGAVQTSLWSNNSSGAVPSDNFYYDEAEGLELLASVGIDPKTISFNAPIIDTSADLFVAIQGQYSKVGINMQVESLEPEANFTFLMNGEWSFTAGNSGYSDAAPYGPWTYILRPEHLIKECWQDIYDPELYELMLDEYDKMRSALTWDEMITHCKQLTTYEQDDFGGMPGVQAPYFAAIGKDLKNVVFFTENHFLQLYYMYK